MYVVGAVDVLFMFLKEGNAVSPEEAKEAVMVLKRANVSRKDLRSILVSFSCTIGQSHIISSEIEKLLMKNEVFVDIKSHIEKVFANEFIRWHRGDLDPCQLINLIETSSSRRDISGPDSIRLIDRILLEGGHLSSSTNSSCTNLAATRPISFQCSKFSYLSITALSTLNTGCLASLTNAVALLSPLDDRSGVNVADSHKYEERYHVNIDTDMKTSLNPLVNYCRVHGAEDLLCCDVGINVSISDNLNQTSAKRASYNFATLMIHDIIVIMNRLILVF